MITTTGTEKTYDGDDSTVEFSFPYKWYDDDHIIVKLNGETQSRGVDYTLAGAGEEAGGTVTMTVAPATGEELYIQRVLPVTQEVDLNNQKAYFLETLEQAIDELVMIIQQQQVTLEEYEAIINS